MAEKYRYDEAYQQRIVALILKDPVFLDQYEDIVVPSYFELSYLSTIVNIAKQLHGKFGQVPSKATLIEKIRDFCNAYGIESTIRQNIAERINDIYDIDLYDIDIVKSEVIRFGQHQALAKATLQIADMVENEEDYEQARDIVDNALRVGTNTADLGISLFNSLGTADVRKIVEKSVASQFKVPTGIPTFDKMVYGGPGKREVWIILGLPGCLAADTVVSYRRGKRPGARYTTIQQLYAKFNGVYNKEWDLSIPTYTHSFDLDNKIIFNQIAAVIKSGDKRVIKINTTNECSLTLTPEHKVCLHDGSFVEAGSLSVGSKLLCKGSMRPVYCGGKSAVFRRAVVETLKYHPYAPVHEVNGCYYGRVSYARCVVEASLNNISVDEYIQILKKDPDRSATLTFIAPGFDVHHIDENQFNDEISNLMIIKHDEHQRVHAKTENLNIDYLRTEEVISIEDAGVQPTYDIQMAHPYNNFCANDFVVHNSGKSQYLVNMGCNALANDEPVVHITIGDLKESDVFIRYVSNLSYSEQFDVIHMTDNFVRKLEKIQRYTDRYLRIKYYTPGTATPKTVRAYLSKLYAIDGIKPGLVIVDYPEEFKAYGTDMYQSIGQQYSELMAIAEDFNCLIWTASQVNRSDLKDPNKLIRMVNIAESWKKCQKADGIVSLNRTDDEKSTGKARLWIDKVRRGQDSRLISLDVDWSCCRLNESYEQEEQLSDEEL
jgi:hypothetical protein